MVELRTVASRGEALSIVAICFGWAILGSISALFGGSQASGDSSASEFSDVSFVGLILTEVFCAGIALLVLQFRGYAVRTLFPTPTLLGCGYGVVLYLAAYVVCILVTAPFAQTAAHEPIQDMLAHATVSMPMLIAVALINGNFEEIFLLGYLARGLNGQGTIIAIGVPLFVRVVYHLYQGPVGALTVLVFGLIVSIYYVRTQKLFPVVFAHVLADIVPFAIR